MVKAILREVDPKTMTRRVAGLEEINQYPDEWLLKTILPDGRYWFQHPQGEKTYLYNDYPKPRYQVGDHIWVKETWAYYPASLPEENRILYKADTLDGIHSRLTDITKWRSGRFMFKKYARLWLEVLAVKAEITKDISLEDAIKEGFKSVKEFLDYFIKLNGKDSIKQWCFAYTFKMLK